MFVRLCVGVFVCWCVCVLVCLCVCVFACFCVVSPYEGKVVELMVEAGAMAKVGEPLCRIELAGVCVRACVSS